MCRSSAPSNAAYPLSEIAHPRARRSARLGSPLRHLQQIQQRLRLPLPRGSVPRIAWLVATSTTAAVSPADACPAPVRPRAVGAAGGRPPALLVLGLRPAREWAAAIQADPSARGTRLVANDVVRRVEPCSVHERRHQVASAVELCSRLSCFDRAIEDDVVLLLPTRRFRPLTTYSMRLPLERPNRGRPEGLDSGRGSNQANNTSYSCRNKHNPSKAEDYARSPLEVRPASQCSGPTGFQSSSCMPSAA